VNLQEQAQSNRSSISSGVRLQVNCTAADSGFPIEQLSPASLAYIGDAVYELYIRMHYLWPPKRISAHHNQVVAQVRAETQAEHLKDIEPYLTDLERDILRRGRNSATTKPRRLAPDLYQKATSLEALIGYLYLINPERLQELLERLQFTPR
jgi:ribonuclease-3 family protein